MISDDEVINVYSFDGQTVWGDRNTVIYEVGNYLGGGAAGTVYECENVQSKSHFALKILNPLGYKLLSPALLRRCTILTKGKLVTDSMERNISAFSIEHVWWLINPSNKQYMAAYYSEKLNSLRECSLTQCTQIWGANPTAVGDDENGDADGTMEVLQAQNGPKVVVPAVPPKYCDFVRKRRRIFREINNMRKISNHTNVIRLESVLELSQESKCTIFLVMELANGGELFDRIKIDCGTREDTAKFFFQQLLLGVKHCHDQGVCHRDLKPENLLLQDSVEHKTILKIADFGFSARLAMGNQGTTTGGPVDEWNGQPTSRQAMVLASMAESPLRVLKSVVGSPFYVAPEVLQSMGYDGTKADIWSLGVILYAMLAGNLPFEQELATCKRFRAFCKWVREQTSNGVQFWDDATVEYPAWLFPAKFSVLARGLIVAMLHPDPEKRVTVTEAMSHPLLGLTASASTSSRGASTGGSSTGAANGDKSTALSDPTPATESGAVDMVHDSPRESSGTHATGVVADLGSTFAASLAIGADKIEIEDQLVNNISTSEAGKTSDILSLSSSDDEDDIEDEEGGCDDDDDDSEQFLMEDDDSDGHDQTSPLHSSKLSKNTKRKDRSTVLETDSDQPYLSPVGSTWRSVRSGHISTLMEIPASDVCRSVQFNADVVSISKTPESPTAYIVSGSSYSPYGTMPPQAPSLVHTRSIDDLLVRDDEPDSPFLGSEQHHQVSPRSGSGTLQPRQTSEPISEPPSPTCDSTTSPLNPPAFIDSVKRSTRFVTSVPAADVLEKVERVLEQYREQKTPTPLGLIGKVLICWDSFRLDVWGVDTSGPPLCSLNLFRLPLGSMAHSNPPSPDRAPMWPSTGSRMTAEPSPSSPLGHITGRVDVGFACARISPGGFPTSIGNSFSGGGVGSFGTGGVGSFGGFSGKNIGGGAFDHDVTGAPAELFLVEFVRGQLEIFAFKRFYQLVRQRLSELVKRDYASSQFDPAVSPMVDSVLLQRFQNNY